MKAMDLTPNLNYVHQLSGGDESFEKKLFSVIKKELPLEIDEYRNNLENKHYQKTAENVHKLKHKISILGFENSYQVAVDYENELKQGSIRFKDDFEKILEAMVAFTATL